jgi:hypothetical protein
MAVPEGPKQIVPDRTPKPEGEGGAAESGKRPEFVGGLIPGVSRKTEGETGGGGDRKSASEQAYEWVVNPHTSKDKRERAQLGPEEQGDFAKPYESFAEALAAEAFLRVTLLPAVLAKFGFEVHQLWASYLNRNPGDGLKPKVFEKKSGVADAFRRCSETQSEQNRILSEVEGKLLGEWDTRVAKLPLNTWVSVPLAELGEPERSLDTNFSNPDNIPGHIAGGVGASDAGPDTRTVGGNMRLRRTGDDTLLLEPDLHFVCNDAIDFIPGNIGTRMESTFTIPLSRLEASGWAYDVPFEVRYPGPVAQVLVERQGGEGVSNRFEEADRNEKIRGNPGKIPDVQSPDAKQPYEVKQDRDNTVNEYKGRVTGKSGKP